jgi:PKD repeat protein
MKKNKMKYGLIPFFVIIMLLFSFTPISQEINPFMSPVIAFDVSKGQTLDDFTGFIGELEALGYTVATIDLSSDGIPDNVEKLIISSMRHNLGITPAYTEAEAILLEAWVAAGGELMVLAEWGPTFTYLTEEITLQFDVTQNPDLVTDTDEYDTSNAWVIYDGYNLDHTHPIFYDVETILFLRGCSLDATEGVIMRTDDDGTATPSNAAVAVAKDWGAGRVAIFGDYNWIADYDDGYTVYDNSKLALNTIRWLNGIIAPPPGATSVRLLAGKTIHIGHVYLWNDNDDIHVLYRTMENWYLLETHFDMKPTWQQLPQNKKHNPQIGLFEFSASFDPEDRETDWYFTFPIPEDMDYGDLVAAAAHAEVFHVFDDCLAVFSDETTQCLGLVPGTPAGDSAYAWDEHPAWGPVKAQFTSGAEWIWISEYVSDPEQNNLAFFTKTFEIPGDNPISLLGEITITCDNEYTLFLNDVTLGDDDDWTTVETYDLSEQLILGENELKILAINHGVSGSTVFTNPAGVLYEATICYAILDQEESAWGEGTLFTPRGSWAMWFEYLINTPPVAVISPEDGSFPWCEPISFDGTGSYDVDGFVVAYYWDFGDGTSSFNPTPVKIYDDLGIYTVELTVVDDQGAVGTTTTTVEVYNTPPVAEFTYTQSPDEIWCEPVYFHDTSYDPDSCDSITYYWEFGDGETRTEKEPVYTYSLGGTYTITLTVTDQYGATNSTNASITIINNPPIADFEYTPESPLLWCEEVYFNAVSFSQDLDFPCDYIVLYEWDFNGDGVFDEEGPYVFHNFTTAGSHDVTLQVTDRAGLQDNITKTITVINTPPIADFEYTPEYSLASPVLWCEEVFFDATFSQDIDISCDYIVWYEWDFNGDGVFEEQGATLYYITHTFYTAGSYDVTLRVTDGAGLQDNHTKTITVLSRPPIAGFEYTPANPTWCEEVYFNAVSFSQDLDFPCDYIVLYEWDFDDDGVFDEEGPYVFHNFTTAGSHDVTLQVTDQSDQQDTETKTIVVSNTLPIASFEYSPGVPYWCDLITFDASASWDYDSFCGDSIVLYEWDFDYDGTYEVSTATPYADHYFGTTGSFIVRLRVTDQAGGTGTYNKTVNVFNNPPIVYDFTVSPPDPETFEWVLFTASLIDEQDPCDYIDLYEWDFESDGTYDATGVMVLHQFTTTGPHDVTLRVKDGLGATSNLCTKTVWVYNP